MPLVRMDCANSSRGPSGNLVRGWYGLGSIRSMSIWSGAPVGAGAGATAVAAAAELFVDADTGAGWDGAGSVSRISAPSPFPNAFLAIGDYLLAQIDVRFRAFAVNIVKVNRLSVAGGLGEPDISWDDGFKHLSTEETSQVRGDLPRESRSLVIHRQGDSLHS